VHHVNLAEGALDNPAMANIGQWVLARILAQ
jgi:hypothetical protein